MINVEPTRLLIADDHPLVLDGIEALFRNTEYDIVARCRDGAQAMEAMAEARPDVMLLDLQMPVRTGLDILRALKAEQNPVRVVLLTASLTNAQALEAIQLGVDGLVLKEAAPRQLVQCLETVRSGQQWLDPEATRKALKQALDKGPGREGEPRLTAREIDIVRLVARGMRNKEIASEVSITEGTVKMHLHNIYDKLGVSTRTELAMYARDHDLG
jgi:two-component system nitrate/nitrite response regulator NarP